MKHTIILLSLLSFSISFAQDVVGISLSDCDAKTNTLFPTISEIELAPPNNNYTLDSLKIGPWHIYDEQTKKLKAKAYYVIDEKGESTTLWCASFNEKGKLVQICANAGVNSQGKAMLSCASKEEYIDLYTNKP